MFATNYMKSFNDRIRSSIFSLLCRPHQSENPLFVNYFHTEEARSTHIGDPYCTHNIVLYLFTQFYNNFNHLFNYY